MKYSRKLRCWYITADVTFAGVSCRLFLIRHTQHGNWNGLLTTNTKLDFFEAYRIYAQRWSQEVVFYDKYIVMQSRHTHTDAKLLIA